MNHSSKLVLLSLALSLTACSTLESDKVNYKSASAAKPAGLEIPPDLTQLSRDTHYAVPGGSVSASNYQQAGAAAAAAPVVAATSMADARIERAGTQRWLVVDRPTDKLWADVKDFWQENGFTLSREQMPLGIMETEWAENRAKLPQDGLRRLIGKALDALYDTGERDKFRTRLESTSTGGTEIYISHRGMVEVYSTNDKTQTVWQPRPADPELEVEFLRRLMVKLGASKEQAQAQAQAAAQAPKQATRVATIDNRPVLQLDEGFDRAWRRVGLALDRTGFTVEDRDRNQGIYFVRYVEPDANKEEPGFFSRMFSGAKAKDKTPQKFRILVKGQGDGSTVTVLNAEGQPETSDIAQRIVGVIADELK